MQRKIVGTLLLSAAILSGCTIEPNAPTEMKPADRPPAELSTLEVTVDLPYAVIERELNQAIPNQLYWKTGQRIEDCPVDECSFQVRVLRDGNITVKHDNSGRVVVHLPIRTTDGRMDAMQKLAVAKVRKHADFSASATATVTLGFSLQPDWTLLPTASLAFHVKRAKARVGFPGGSVGISVKGKMTDALNGQRDSLERKIVQALTDKVDFRPDLASAWRQLHGSWRSSDQTPVWLVVDPVSLQAANPTSTDASLRLVAGVDAYLSTHVQQAMPDRPSPEALPNLKVVQNMSGRYRLSVPISLSLVEVNRQLERLVGREFTFKTAGRKITAKLIDGHAYVNGSDLVVYAKFRAGRVVFGLFPVTVGVYLNGTLKFDASSSTLSVHRFDYDSDTNNLLLDKTEWFFHGTIREALQAELRHDFAEELVRARQQAAENVRAIRINDHMILRGTVDKFAPRAIYTTAKEINVDVLVEGELHLGLQLQ